MSKFTIGFCIVWTATGLTASAETLDDAVRLAYQTHPGLRAQRALLRSTNEQFVQASANLGPQISLSGQLSYQNARIDQGAGPFNSASTARYDAGSGSADLSLVQPLYSNGALSAQRNSAEANIMASRQDLRRLEAQVLETVISAYLNVRRDRQSIKILTEEIEALKGEFAETRAKASLGQLTKTDTAQSEARLLSAQAQLNLTQGRLRASEAQYLAMVGQTPGDLEPESELPGIPATVDEAFASAEANNPELLNAVAVERSAREKVNAAKAASGPTVSVKLDASISPIEPYLRKQYDQSLTAAVVYRQPIYTSGLTSSKIREALEDDNRARLSIEATRRNVIQMVSQAWEQLAASRTAIEIEKRQIEVERVAVKGNRLEERVGTRSTIELLNSELELANARLELLQSQHDAYIARTSLLSAMGLLEARLVSPGLDVYQPDDAFNRATPLVTRYVSQVASEIDRLGRSTSLSPSLQGRRGLATNSPVTPK